MGQIRIGINAKSWHLGRSHRRPSHKNKRHAMQFELLWQNFSAVYARDLNPKKMQQLKNNMLELLLTS